MEADNLNSELKKNTDAPSPQEPLTASPTHRRKWWGMLAALWDSMCDMSLSPLNAYLKTEWPHLRNVLDLFVLFALLAAYAGWLLRDGKVSFLQGQLTEKDKAYGHQEKDRDRIQTDGNNQITQLKMDLNEVSERRIQRLQS